MQPWHGICTFICASAHRDLPHWGIALPQQIYEGAVMKSACLVLLVMVPAFGFRPTRPDGASIINQAPTQAAAENKQLEGRSSRFTPALADATTVPPASASKVPPTKAKNAAAPPCSRQPAVNHDAEVIPTGNKTQWPQTRLPTEEQMHCQAQKPIPKPPPNSS